MSMEEARHYCQRRHSDLVTISSEAESVFIWKRVNRNVLRYKQSLATVFKLKY